MKHLLVMAALLWAAMAGASWLDHVPSSYVARQNPYAARPDAVPAGAKLFQRHCALCHGQDAGGTRRAPALNSPAVRDAPPGALFWLLRNGIIRRGMPSWTVLPEPQRWQIVSYLKTLVIAAAPASPGRSAAPPPGPRN